MPHARRLLSVLWVARLAISRRAPLPRRRAREKKELKVQTTYWCCVNCPGNPEAWNRHAPYHKQVKRFRQVTEDGGVMQQRDREIAERDARHLRRRATRTWS